MTTGPSKTFGDMQRIAQGGGAVLFASLIGNSLNYLYAIFLARALGPGDFGLYALGQTIFTVLVIAAPLGLETGIVRFVSRDLGRQDVRSARLTIVQCAVVVTAAGIVVGLALIAFSTPISVWLYGETSLTRALWLFGTAIPLGAGSALLLEAMKCFQPVRYTVLVKYVWEPCGKFLFSALFLWAGYALLGVVGSMVVTLLVSLTILSIGVRRVAGIRLRDARSYAMTGTTTILAFCLPLTVSNVFGALAPRSDVLILGYWVSSAEVGVYSAVAQTAAVLALVLSSLNTLCAPTIGEIAATQDRARLRDVYQAVARWTLLCTVPAFSLLVIFGQDILALFGRMFAGGATCLVILAFGQAFYSSVGLSSTILLMFGHSRTVMWNTVSLAILLIGGNWVLIPRWGIVGAALAVSVSMAAISVVGVFQVWRRYRVQPYTWSLVKPIVAGVLMAGFGASVKGVARPAIYPLVGILVVAAYIGLLALFRFEERDRWVFGTVLAKLKPTYGVPG